nr:RepB family protein [Escherichia coli]
MSQTENAVTSSSGKASIQKGNPLLMQRNKD